MVREYTAHKALIGCNPGSFPSTMIRPDPVPPAIYLAGIWWAAPDPKRKRKKKPHGRHPLNALSAAFVRQVGEAGRYCDGDGLYLEVHETGRRCWIQRLVIRKRRCELGLGGFPLVSLKEARAEAFANRKLARAGGDPLAEKRRTRGIPTFAEAAGRVLEQKRAGWRNEKHAHDWWRSLKNVANGVRSTCRAGRNGARYPATSIRR